MSSPHTGSRRPSSHQQEQSCDGLLETEPLLLTRTRSQGVSVAESVAVQEIAAGESSDDDVDAATPPWPSSVKYLVLLCAALTSSSFGVTQVPLLYVFRLMTCDAYYKNHPSQLLNPSVQSRSVQTVEALLLYVLAPESHSSATTIQSGPDRCSKHAIETSTALSISLLGASTTVFGIINLFLTGSLIKRIGVKPTLLIQVFFPALRLLVQNVGVEVWGSTGIIIIQCSQILTIFGGPSGYLLVLNTFITEVVEHEGRTAALGRLTGSMMFGSALGFLLGGVVAENYGIKAPFRLTLILFLSSCAYVAVFLPHIPPAATKVADRGATDGENKARPVSKFYGPLAVFAPRKFIRKDGVVHREYGAFLLAWGVFLGILATGYLPTLLQLYSTDVFGFKTKQNGWLIFMYSMLRGLFLTFAFPKLISLGRKRTTRQEEAGRHAETSPSSPSSPEREPLLKPPPQHPATPATRAAGTGKNARKPAQTFTFDLTYTRYSLVADGLLTLLCTFVRRGWQMYLVAAILPFAAGTGAASKGTILQMVGGSTASSAERTDALAGISLVENMARLSTTFVFGVVFASFAAVGRTELVFTCNAAVALVGFGVVLFARFPPQESRLLGKEDDSSATPVSEDGHV